MTTHCLQTPKAPCYLWTSRKAIRTTSSWFSCVSFRCCEIFLLSSSRVPRGNGGLCSARSLSCFSLCRRHGTSIQADCNSHTGRNTPPRKTQIFPCLSPFGRETQQFYSRGVSERVNRWCHPVFIYTRSRDHGCAARWFVLRVSALFPLCYMLFHFACSRICSLFVLFFTWLVNIWTGVCVCVCETNKTTLISNQCLKLKLL